VAASPAEHYSAGIKCAGDHFLSFWLSAGESGGEAALSDITLTCLKFSRLEWERINYYPAQQELK